ncbi:MAG TPA: CHASE3 domain-containing protein, partial [Longimicrobium sp.]|nr:CHASE3 domain-containing protein [Longimicrobium sp.]
MKQDDESITVSAMHPGPSPRPLRLSAARRLAATFGATLVVLIFGALAYQGAQRERAVSVRVNESHDVIEELQRALGAALDGETGQRGYLLTGRAEYLQPYARARDSMHASLLRLDRATASDLPGQRARVDSLRAALRSKLDELEETISLAEAGDRAAALEVVASGRGKERMDRARELAVRIERHERAELDALERRQARYATRLTATLLLGTALATAVSLLLNSMLARYGASQERFSAEVERANRLLEEQQVELELQNEQLADQSAEMEAQNARLQLLADELAARTEAAEAANLAKARFLAAMSHDLRTPLNAIGGYVDLLEMGVRGPVNEAQSGDLQRIRHSARRLLAMINDILSFARIEAGHVEVRPEAVPLDAAVREMESSFLPQAAERGLEYAFVP